LHAALANGGVDADDPELAEVALADATVAGGEGARSDERFFDGAQQCAASADKPLGLLEQAAFGLGPRRTFGRSHRSLPRESRPAPEIRSALDSPSRVWTPQVAASCVAAFIGRNV